VFVSQPVLALSFSLALGFLAAAAVASSALARTRKSRAFRMFAFAAAIIVVGRVTAASGLHFNVTPSMPLGIYRLAPVPKSGVQRGMFVAACAPIDAARLGRRRGYLANGRCAADTEPLVKVVAAVAGDEVTISSRGVSVNECLLPHSRPLKFDSAGRPLSPWPRGRYRLRRGQLWLYAGNDRSWDSRYWGRVPISDVLARAQPVVASKPSASMTKRFFQDCDVAASSPPPAKTGKWQSFRSSRDG
jgi:conjugative transfer signal peptidase TraF